MSTTLQDIINNVDDISGQYDTGTVKQKVQIRHINRSIEWCKRKLGFPSDERKQTITFSQDQLFYDLNDDVDELLFLFWDEDRYNVAGNEWEHVPYEEIIRVRGRGVRGFRFGETHINGDKQIAIHGYNQRGGDTIDSMDSVGDWEISGDGSNLAQDTIKHYEGIASLSFDITNSTGSVMLDNDDFNLDIEDLIEHSGMIKFHNWMSDANIDDVTLYLYEDASNYWTITEDDQDDGTAFEADKWTKLGFSLDDKVVGAGDPDPNEITRIKIEYDLGAGFTSASDFRIDRIYTVFPDDLDLVYKSNIKGTDLTGTTNRTQLSDVTDIVLLGHDDLIDVVAMKAALRIWPTLRGDKEFMANYKSELNELLRDYARRAPRKRTAGTRRTSLRRS